MRRIIVLSCLGLFLSFIPFEKAEALSVSPLIFEFTSRSGEIVSGSLRIVNETNTEANFEPMVQDFLPSTDESGSPVFLSADTLSKNSIQTWVTFAEPFIVLEPNGETFLNFTITVPANTKAGGYYGALLLSSKTITDETITLGTKVGSLVLISVQGETEEIGGIKEFSANDFFLSHLPAKFSIRFENSGNTHLIPRGEIIILDVLGNKKTVLPINLENGFVLPNSIRKFEADWQNQEVEKEQPEWIKEWKNFGIGPYQAILTLSYGQNEQTVEAQTWFWIIPWQLILTGVVILLVLILLAKLRRKKTCEIYH